MSIAFWVMMRDHKSKCKKGQLQVLDGDTIGNFSDGILSTFMSDDSLPEHYQKHVKLSLKLCLTFTFFSVSKDISALPSMNLGTTFKDIFVSVCISNSKRRCFALCTTNF